MFDIKLMLNPILVLHANYENYIKFLSSLYDLCNTSLEIPSDTI
jgi:hypothetical protein